MAHGITWDDMGVNGNRPPQGRIGNTPGPHDGVRVLCAINANKGLGSGGAPARIVCKGGLPPSQANARKKLKRKRKYQPVCKPGSVWPHRPEAARRDGHSSWTDVAIGLVRPTRTAGRKRPEGCPSCRSYSVLLPVGFTVPLLLPEARWALTPPFHPYPVRILACPCEKA